MKILILNKTTGRLFFVRLNSVIPKKQCGIQPLCNNFSKWNRLPRHFESGLLQSSDISILRSQISMWIKFHEIIDFLDKIPSLLCNDMASKISTSFYTVHNAQHFVKFFSCMTRS